jgi:mannose-6-phosphate isomerase-like protein (cupin superfamily)
MEAVYYVIDGTAVVVDPRNESRQELVPGSMVHVDSGTPYVFIAGNSGVEIVGGPCPPDPAMYTHLEGR